MNTPTNGFSLIPCPLCKNHERFIEVSVPSDDLHIDHYGDLYQGRRKSEWKICGVCGFVHQNPRPSIEALNRFYLSATYHNRAEAPTLEQYRQFSRWYFSEKLDYLTGHTGLRTGQVFDVGCGYGGALTVFQERGWKCHGIEADPNCVSFAHTALGLIGVQHGVLAANTEPKGSIDVVFSNHAFEHFADLETVLKGITRILRSGGYVFTVVPTYYSNRSTLSKRWMNSAHYSLFTHNSLNQLFAKYGLEEVNHTYRGWWKEIDELWHLSQLIGEHRKSREYFEDPGQVSQYMTFVNPIRSVLFGPIFSHFTVRRQLLQHLIHAFRLLVRSPREFTRKVCRRLRKVWSTC